MSSRATRSSNAILYRRVEHLATLVVSLMLFSGGLALGLGAFKELERHRLFYMTTPVDPGSAGIGVIPSTSPELNAAWLVCFEVVAKAWLYKTTMQTARDTGNTALKSNAHHYGMDALGALVPLFTALISGLVPHTAWLDSLGSLAISSMVVKAGWENSRKASSRLFNWP